jgi:hypothetical protein
MESSSPTLFRAIDSGWADLIGYICMLKNECSEKIGRGREEEKKRRH